MIASTVTGVDERLKFAIIVYGCGYISQPSDDGPQFVGTKATPENVESWRNLWDPENFLPAANIPILWVTGTNGFAFTLRAWQIEKVRKRGRAVCGDRCCVRNRWNPA